MAEKQQRDTILRESVLGIKDLKPEAKNPEI
jgi:hypothetical protein